MLNAAEAAAFLRTHVETVRRLARQGKLPSFKVGKDWRFHRQALLGWVEKQHPPRKPRPAPRSPRILIVDDEEKFREALRRIVTKMGCQARCASDGASGLRAVAEALPDLILLDLVMPGMSGPAFLAELRRHHPTLPVVIVTGYPDSELVQQALQHGPLLLLAKPAAPTRIEQAVRLALGEAHRSAVQVSP